MGRFSNFVIGKKLSKKIDQKTTQFTMKNNSKPVKVRYIRVINVTHK